MAQPADDLFAFDPQPEPVKPEPPKPVAVKPPEAPPAPHPAPTAGSPGAYSASSKIITTADEMLAELINIKR